MNTEIIEEKIKEGEDLFEKLTEQQTQVSNAIQQTIGRVTTLKEIKDLLQTENEKTEANSIC